MSSDTPSGDKPRRPPVFHYAVALQQAQASGDLQKMRDLSREAHGEGSSDPEIQSALRELDAEIARLSPS